MTGPYCTMLGTYRWNPSLMVGTDTDAQSPSTVDGETTSVCFKPSILRNWRERLCLIYLCPHQLLSGSSQDRKDAASHPGQALSWGIGAIPPAQTEFHLQQTFLPPFLARASSLTPRLCRVKASGFPS